jgi:hypothetical protein
MWTLRHDRREALRCRGAEAVHLIIASEAKQSRADPRTGSATKQSRTDDR